VWRRWPRSGRSERIGTQPQPGLGDPVGCLAGSNAVGGVAEQYAADSVVLCTAVKDAVDGVRGDVAQVLGGNLSRDVLDVLAAVERNRFAQVGGESVEEDQIVALRVRPASV
jgi:hypothetical protein